jgi:hypothetical protein
MKIDYLPRALKALEDAPGEVRRAFFKQVMFLEKDLRHPSLREQIRRIQGPVAGAGQ